MKNRTVKLSDVDEVITEKIEWYQEWLGKGLINQSEFNDRKMTLDSIRSLLLFRSIPTDYEIPGESSEV